MEKSNRPLMVTVQTITFNQERYIRQCLEGIVNQQTNFRFEAIIHDDASTDNTANIILEYADKYPDIIKPIIEKENQYSKFDGSLARIMLENTKGKYYAICEGDDYWIDPLKLQKQYDYMESHPHCSMCFHSVYDLLPTGEKKEDRPAVIKEEYGVEDVIMGAGGLIRLASSFYRTEFLAKEGYPEYWIKAPIGDYPSTMYYAAKGQIGYINEIMSVYRVHAVGAWTSHEKTFKGLRSHKNAIVEMMEGFDEYTERKYHNFVKNGVTKNRKTYRHDMFVLLCKKVMRFLGVYDLYKKIKVYSNSPRIIFRVILSRLGRFIKDDRSFIKIDWRINMDYPLNLDAPKTYNEKLQWLKLYNREPIYTIMVDKVKVKNYVASILGGEFIIPTIGVWDDPDKIDFDALPERFVLKCNHNSGTGMYICKDRSQMNVEEVKSGLRKALKEDYYIKNREWPYKDVPRRILAEKYLDPSSGNNDLPDYKLFCFDGEVKVIEVDYNRFIHHNRNLYSPEWKRINAEIGFPSLPGVEFERPEGLEVAICAAEKLSKGIPHVRVDFYIVDGHVYFGEMTFYHGSGHEWITPRKFDEEMGSWIHAF